MRRTDDPLVDVQQVVGTAMTRSHDRLPHCAALRGEQVEILAVHDGPAGGLQLIVDEDAGSLLCGKSLAHVHRADSSDSRRVIWRLPIV